MNDANNAGTLALCPFCGSAPCQIPQNDDCRLPDQSGYYQTIWCENCGAESGKRQTGGTAIKAWNTRALSTPNAPVEREDKRANQVIGEAIKKHTYGSIRGTLTKAIVSELHRNGFSILAVRLDEAAIRKDEREKCLNQVCESLFVLADGWKEQPGKEETATAVSNAAVFICGKERAIAIRNGGKP